jgi:hypothetical protein
MGGTLSTHGMRNKSITTFLSEEREGNRLLGRTRSRWHNNIKMGVRTTFVRLRIGTSDGSCEDSNER